MATRKEIESMIGKIMLDTEFSKEVMESPEEAAKKIGIELTPEQAQAFKAQQIHIAAAQLEKMASKGRLL